MAQLSTLTGPASLGSEVALAPATGRGDLGESSWRDALIEFEEGRPTGIVVVHAFREIRWCYLVDGRPVHYALESTHPGEFLSDFLVGEGGLSAEQWVEALKEQKLTGLPAGECLVRRGVIGRDKLQAALLRRAAAITRNLVRANFGDWSLHPLPQLKEIFPWAGVDTLPLLLDLERKVLAGRSEEELIAAT